MTAVFWWAITALALVGAILNARLKWQGFVCWIVSNAAMCSKAVWLQDWPQAFLWVVYTGISVVGLVTWLRKAKA